MNNFISDESRERLIKANADASGDIGAVAFRLSEQNFRQNNMIRIVVDNTCSIQMVTRVERGSEVA